MTHRTNNPILLLAFAALAALFASMAVQAAPSPASSQALKTYHTTANCNWDSPGHNPYMGDVVAAVDRYPDIPADVRARLKDRMAKRQYDDIATIKRDEIAGKNRYDPVIHGMHFGQDSVCTNVTRAGWSDSMEERGLVYCDSGECILVPTICRNVSRISPAVVGAPPVATSDDPLLFAPPGAGPAGPADSFTSGITPTGGDGVAAPLASSDSPLAFDAPGAGPEGIAPPAAFVPTLPPGTPSDPGFPVPPVIVPPPDTPPIAPIPEPETWALMALGLGVLALRQRRKAR